MSVIPFPGRPWTRDHLLKAYGMAEKGAALREIAPCVGRTMLEVDIALWGILCTETVSQALELLNGTGSGGVKSPVAAVE